MDLQSNRLDTTSARKRIMLIINPISGTGSKKGVPEMVEERLAKAGFQMDLRFTGGRGDATDFASEAARTGYAGVLACGGDGTINETARALCGSDTALGILPAGSGNGLARHLGIPVDIELALQIIEQQTSCVPTTAQSTECHSSARSVWASMLR